MKERKRRNAGEKAKALGYIFIRKGNSKDPKTLATHNGPCAYGTIGVS